MARILLLLPDHDQRRALDRILSEGGHAAFQTATVAALHIWRGVVHQSGTTTTGDN
mgnify:CR=1 FL=1